MGQRDNVKIWLRNSRAVSLFKYKSNPYGMILPNPLLNARIAFTFSCIQISDYNHFKLQCQFIGIMAGCFRKSYTTISHRVVWTTRFVSRKMEKLNFVFLLNQHNFLKNTSYKNFIADEFVFNMNSFFLFSSILINQKLVYNVFGFLKHFRNYGLNC